MQTRQNDTNWGEVIPLVSMKKGETKEITFTKVTFPIGKLDIIYIQINNTKSYFGAARNLTEITKTKQR